MFTFVKSSKIIYIIFILASFLNFSFCKDSRSQNGGTNTENHTSGIIFDKSEHKGKGIFQENQPLVNLFNIIPHLKTEWHYAGFNNFTGQILYKNPKPYLVKPAAEALKNVADSLQKLGLGILLFDAYRPHSVSVKMWKIVQNPAYVADPSKGSNHNRGTAVDMSLYDLKTGKALKMPTKFDDFTPKAHLDYNKLPATVKRNRDLLKNIMSHFGFRPYNQEWWHYTFITTKKYEILNIDFSELPD